MREEFSQNIDLEQIEFAETMQIHASLSAPGSSAVRPETGPPKKPKPSGEINFLTPDKQKKLIDSIENIRHKVAFLIMLDAGLRVTETVTLQIKNFDFKKKVINVKSLKKRSGKEHIRQVPMSARLIDAMALYLQKLKPKTEEDYLFPKPNGEGHVSRKAMNRACDRLKEKNPSLSNLHPHALRHSFATNLLTNGTELHNVKELLGHQSYNTTLIYNHTPLEVLRKNITDATTVKQKWYQKLWLKIIGKKPTHINFTITNQNQFIVGREDELFQVVECLNKNINVILIGKIGIGKTHILRQLDFPGRKILKLDEMSNLKMTFVNLLLYILNNDKEHVKNLMFGEFDNTQIQQRLQRDSLASLIDEVKRITQKHEYILQIDNVDGITTKGMKVIEELKDHFTIITTAREVPLSKANFLWNFERIEIKPLSRTASLELIHKLSYDMDIEDYELYRNHIFDQSSGNPRVIFELCERYRKELIITDDVIRQVRHIGGIPEIDMSFVIVFILAGIAVLRYTSREMGGANLRFIGGIALVLLMLTRYFMARTKRKFI